jgi:hypothetical protein
MSLLRCHDGPWPGLFGQNYNRIVSRPIDAGSKRTAFLWESGGLAISPVKLDELLDLLKPPSDATKQLVLLIRPSIVEGVDEWLETQIAEETWPTISFPALDAQWLAVQHPAEIRAGVKSKWNSWLCFRASPLRGTFQSALKGRWGPLCGLRSKLAV